MLTYLLCKTTSISTGVDIRQQDRQLRGYSHCGSTAAPRFKGLRDHHSGRSGNMLLRMDAFEAFDASLRWMGSIAYLIQQQNQRWIFGALSRSTLLLGL